MQFCSACKASKQVAVYPGGAARSSRESLFARACLREPVRRELLGYSARACPRGPVRRELLGYSARACPRGPVHESPSAKARPRGRKLASVGLSLATGSDIT